MDNNNFEYVDYNVEEQSGNKDGLNVFGLISMICGILALLLNICCFCPYIGWAACIAEGVLAVAAIVLGIIGIKHNNDKKGMAIAGIITGAVALLIVVIVVVLFILVMVFGVSVGILDVILNS